jgi:AcrR family transcriptional regulator
MTRAKRDSYHHGDARSALLAAATALLEKVGAQGLSVRGLAARAGLSRQAPYNHFPDKEALLAELVGEGFRRLSAEISATPGYPASAASLERAAEAYIGFAQRSPALFRLMFSRELVDISRFPEVTKVASEAFGSMRRIIATLTGPARVDELALAAWCLVHGYATLCIENGLENERRRTQRARMFARMLRKDAT